MSRKLLCLLIALALLLSGCIYRSGADGADALVVYRLDSSEHGSELVRVKVATGDGEAIDTLVAALGDDTGAVPSRSPLAGKAHIEGVSVEKGVAIVDMSPGYAKLQGAELILAESAIVLSLCAIDKVCYVDIRCEGELLKSGLSPECYTEADGLCGNFERSVKLYLPDESGSGLVPRTLTVSEDGGMNGPQRVMSALLSQLDGMDKAEIVALSVDDGLCSIDLSHEFYGVEPAESFTGMLMIYSIVNSLCRVPGVERVSLSVDGYSIESFGGFRTHWPLSENQSIIIY